MLNYINRCFFIFHIYEGFNIPLPPLTTYRIIHSYLIYNVYLCHIVHYNVDVNIVSNFEHKADNINGEYTMVVNMVYSSTITDTVDNNYFITLIKAFMVNCMVA